MKADWMWRYAVKASGRDCSTQTGRVGTIKCY